MRNKLRPFVRTDTAACLVVPANFKSTPRILKKLDNMKTINDQESMNESDEDDENCIIVEEEEQKSRHSLYLCEQKSIVLEKIENEAEDGEKKVIEKKNVETNIRSNLLIYSQTIMHLKLRDRFPQIIFIIIIIIILIVQSTQS